MVKMRLRKGYIQEKNHNHPAANENGLIGQHKLVVEEYLKQKLPPGYIVHHIDFNKMNNKIENLLLVPNNATHLRLHRLYKSSYKEYKILFEAIRESMSWLKDNNIDLNEEYVRQQKVIKADFVKDLSFRDVEYLICENIDNRREHLKRLKDKYGIEKLSDEISNVIIIKLIPFEYVIWELLWGLGELSHKANLVFLTNLLVDWYENIQYANTIIQAMIAIYKLVKDFPEYKLTKKDYLLFCKNFVSDSKDAILWSLRIINNLHVPTEVKKNLYAHLNTNKLYFKSEFEFRKLLEESPRGLETDNIDLS